MSALKWSVALQAMLLLGVPIRGLAEPFTIAILPDTQNYSQSYPQIFNAQTQWIADNSVAENIKFVIHLGDITNNNNAPQWQNAQNAMRILDGLVPYSVVPGNHDIGTNGSADVRNTDLYNTYFPVSHYSGGPTSYSFSAVLRSTDNDGIGLVFRYQNANNYYKLDLDNERAFRKIFKVVGGVATTIATQAGAGYTVGANTSLKVTASGNQIQVFQDDVPLFGGPVTDGSLATGTVGLYSWGQQNAFFDDVAVD